MILGLYRAAAYLGEPIIRVLSMTARYRDIVLDGGSLTVLNDRLILTPPTVTAGWPQPDVVLVSLVCDDLDITDRVQENGVENPPPGHYRALWNAANGRAADVTASAGLTLADAGETVLRRRFYPVGMGIIFYDPAIETGSPATAVSGSDAVRIEGGLVAIDTDRLPVGDLVLKVTSGGATCDLPLSLSEIAIDYDGQSMVGISYPADTPADAAITYSPVGGIYDGEIIAFTPADLVRPYSAIPPAMPVLSSDAGSAGVADAGDTLGRGRAGLWVFLGDMPEITVALHDESGICKADFAAGDYVATGTENTALFTRETAGGVMADSPAIVVAAVQQDPPQTLKRRDEFLGAAGSDLATYTGESGIGWRGIGAALDGNGAAQSAVSTGSGVFFVERLDDLGTDYAVEAEMRMFNPGTNDGLGLAVRIQPPGGAPDYVRGYYARHNGSEWSIFSRNSASSFTRIEDASFNTTYAAGELLRMRLECRGNLFRLYENGVLILSCTDAANRYPTGRGGVCTRASAGFKFENFHAEAL